MTAGDEMEIYHLYMQKYKVYASVIEPEDNRDPYLTTIDPVSTDDLDDFVRTIQTVVDIVLIQLNSDAEQIKSTIINTKGNKGIN